jgi:hypothetical protein
MRIAKDFKKAIDIIAQTYGYNVEYENDVPVFVKGNQ